eukprot:Blabericola_migrator_1__3206@NODE_1943_length_3530_cov_39_481663_g1241_i0_p2_GENE_NODE_1943_length_3530_cov_39_481663_g1241_i0NODE_1943_length_3530_cov_39_481663_g1241_i0_p2_ORF_typecomplete_len185_score25_21_NODE_1943_length_3530_cov_39_481663_g1241_i029173471
MYARAASATVQQAHRSQRIRSKHDTTLLFTGVVMAMTSDYTGVDTAVVSTTETPKAQIWQTDVHNYKDFLTYDGEDCGGHLIERGLLGRQANNGDLKLLVTKRNLHKMRDVKDLVALNQYLDVKIAQGTKMAASSPADRRNWFEWAVNHYGSLCEDQVRCSPDETTAGESNMLCFALVTRPLCS